MINPKTPVLVGVAQVLYRLDSYETLIEPVDMMLDACNQAASDAGNPNLLGQLQSVRVIRGVWQYDNPARYLAEKLGVPTAQTAGTHFGGNQVQYVVNQTAVDLLEGRFDLVLITGAENGYSLAKARKAGKRIQWRQTPGSYDTIIGYEKAEHHEHELARGINQAIQIYPMYENAMRHHLGESIDQHLRRVSGLWSRFNEVALNNPNAWIKDRYTAEQIATPSPSNRLISVPYTKLMNSNNAVDMSAALVMCTVERARKLGIPPEKWIYPQSGADGVDHSNASIRDNFYSSPGIGLVGRRALELASTSIESLSYVDLYSCFPSAVQIAARELGLKETDQLTITGGLTFAGGPLNNYVMHSIARMVELLRIDRDALGMITANGGNLSKHAHAIYSGQPPERDFRWENVQEHIDQLPRRETIADYQGNVTVESYTAMFGADGPERGYFACLTPAGQRVWAVTDEPGLLDAMTREEFCGRSARLDGTGGIKVI